MSAVDTIIIGAGMSGLAAGIRLAMFGRAPLILERHTSAGGMNSYYRRRGVEFDVGLHAVTNYVPRKTRGAPLIRLLKQLRIGYDELQLAPQIESKISFDHGRVTLAFNNEPDYFLENIRALFPNVIDGVRQLDAFVQSYNDLDLDAPPEDSSDIIDSFISDPLLKDMLLEPLMYYGSWVPRTMRLDNFVTIYKALYKEGFARPRDGVRTIIDLLLKKYRDAGGELQLRQGVKEIVVENGRVSGAVTDSGEFIRAKNILSSAGRIETNKLIKTPSAAETDASLTPGQLSFTETIYVLNQSAKSLGIDSTIVFYNDKERFRYESPKELIDDASGVICCPGNYQYDTPLETEPVRVTNLASYSHWKALSQDDYRKEKGILTETVRSSAERHVAPFGHAVRFTDMFTPLTVERYTGRVNGAVYGSPDKVKNGRTAIHGLYLIGTDQGFLGIAGAILSGITVANKYLLGS